MSNQKPTNRGNDQKCDTGRSSGETVGFVALLFGNQNRDKSRKRDDAYVSRDNPHKKQRHKDPEYNAGGILPGLSGHSEIDAKADGIDDQGDKTRKQHHMFFLIVVHKATEPEA